MWAIWKLNWERKFTHLICLSESLVCVMKYLRLWWSVRKMNGVPKNLDIYMNLSIQACMHTLFDPFGWSLVICSLSPCIYGPTLRFRCPPPSLENLVSVPLRIHLTSYGWKAPSVNFKNGVEVIGELSLVEHETPSTILQIVYKNIKRRTTYKDAMRNYCYQTLENPVELKRLIHTRYGLGRYVNALWVVYIIIDGKLDDLESHSPTLHRRISRSTFAASKMGSTCLHVVRSWPLLVQSLTYHNLQFYLSWIRSLCQALKSLSSIEGGEESLACVVSQIMLKLLQKNVPKETGALIVFRFLVARYA